MIDTSLREEYQMQAIDEIKDNKPKAIVYSNMETSGLWNEESPKIFIDYLNKLINDDYRLIGGWMWQAGGGKWVEKFSTDEIDSASLLLYKKIY